MRIAFLILSPLALMWLVAEFYHPPTREVFGNLKRNLFGPLWRSLTYPVGKQREAFGQFFVGVAIASCVGAATVAFETNWGAATWVLYVKLVGLSLGMVLSLALASLFYGTKQGD